MNANNEKGGEHGGGNGGQSDEHRAYKVQVIYDGETKEFTVRREELVKKLLEQAIERFGPLPNPHTLSLYDTNGELDDNKTLEVVGVKEGDTLLLRPSKIKGGK